MGFFQAVKAPAGEGPRPPASATAGKTPLEIERAVQEIVDRAVAPDGIVDLFDVAGLQQPDISLLSDEFLLEVQILPQKNVAVELLRRLIEGRDQGAPPHAIWSRPVPLPRCSSEPWTATTTRPSPPPSSSTSSIALAQEMREAQDRGEDLGLNSDELAFYDALAANESAVDVMGDEQLALIARELVTAVRRNATIDWAVQESARAKMRTAVKRILRRYGYPPDLQAAATRTVVQQAELFAAGAA